MIEFQLTIYMCSHCTRVHNDPRECLRHEIDEHSPNEIIRQPAATLSTNGDPIKPPTDTSQLSPIDHPSVIMSTNDVKPNPNNENETENREESSGMMTPNNESEENSEIGGVATNTFEASTSTRVKVKTNIKRRSLRKSQKNALKTTNAKQPSNQRKQQTANKKHVCNVCKVSRFSFCLKESNMIRCFHQTDLFIYSDICAFIRAKDHSNANIVLCASIKSV